MAMEIARASIPQVARNLGELMAQGFTISPPLLSETELSPLREVVDGMQLNSKTRGGVRNLLRSSRVLARAVEEGPIAKFARSLAGAGARPTKLTLFNKSRQANWTIRWHQDAMIAVAERREASGFCGWSEKEGVVHVRPPAHVLESIVALRVHLDDTPALNGPLRVLPGTHVMGLLDREQIESCRREHREVVCEVAAGGVMAMKPLLLHASSKAAVAASRRVLHVEYSATDLPNGLKWA